MIQEPQAIKRKYKLSFTWHHLVNDRKAWKRKIEIYKGGYCQNGKRQATSEPAQYECYVCGRRTTSKIDPHTGCKRNRLIPVYQTLIRSILDYGSLIYSLAPKSQLALLDPIQNSAIRICTGAVSYTHLTLPTIYSV